MKDEQLIRTPTSSIGYLHAFFCFVYLVLLANIVVLTLHQSNNFPPLPVLDRVASLFYDPFRGNIDLDILEGIWPGPAILFALISFGLFHFGIAKSRNVDLEVSGMNYVVGVFRLTFYVCMTLLLILIVIRTAVMAYHDFTQPYARGVIWRVGSPNK